jgi:hypothetical protein
LSPGSGDLALTAGWGIVQERAIMPGTGKYDVRERTAADNESLTKEEQDVLGEQVIDIHLNDQARWTGISAAVWD